MRIAEIAAASRMTYGRATGMTACLYCSSSTGYLFRVKSFPWGAGSVHAVPQTRVVGAVAYSDGGQMAPRELLRCIKTFL